MVASEVRARCLHHPRLVVRQVITANPAAPVRGPKHVVRKGKTAVLSAEQARTLLESISTDSTLGSVTGH